VAVRFLKNADPALPTFRRGTRRQEKKEPEHTPAGLIHENRIGADQASLKG
jgi:hypothetical protein